MLVDIGRFTEEIADKVIEKINAARFEPQIDTYMKIEELADHMNLSKETVRKVVKKMEREGEPGIWRQGSTVRVSFEKFAAYKGERRR